MELSDGPLDARHSARQPTLRDIAAVAGVDPSAVSRVLNGESISVRPETRECILAAARELEYRPNAHARGLRLKRSGAIGLLLPDITNPVYAEIVRGAVRRGIDREQSVLIAEIRASEDRILYQRLLQEKRIDGLLVATARQTTGAFEASNLGNIPHVFVNRRADDHGPSVIVDDAAGAALAAQRLIDAGHRNLAILAGPEDLNTSQRRLDGFMKAAASVGVPSPIVVRDEFSASGGHRAMTTLLAKGQRPTGLFVSTFVSAVGALHAARQHGCSVPLHMSMVVFDDAEIAGYLDPPLTAVKMPFEEMGALGVDWLMSVLAGRDPGSVVVPTPPVLVERDSVAKPFCC